MSQLEIETLGYDGFVLFLERHGTHISKGISVETDFLLL
jgi:hypothetical protein